MAGGLFFFCVLGFKSNILTKYPKVHKTGFFYSDNPDRDKTDKTKMKIFYKTQEKIRDKMALNKFQI